VNAAALPPLQHGGVLDILLPLLQGLDVGNVIPLGYCMLLVMASVASGRSMMLSS
jgi:hypothetical protein